MARKRGLFGRRARARTGFFKRRMRSRSKSNGSAQLIQPDAMLYRAGTSSIAHLASPLIGMLPLGNLSDEVTLGLIDWFVAKNTSGMISSAARKGLIVENAMLAQGATAGLIGTSTTSVNAPTYG